ncbi:MAG: hypothetical protein H7248_09985 [Microbacteriaceae bacterium]|nr:hypothetical protein [Microbacteriaceae bacterium]
MFAFIRTARLPILATVVAGLVFVPLSPAIAAQPRLAAPASTLAATAVDNGSPAVWSVQASNANGPDGRESLAYSVGSGTEIKDYISVSNGGKSAQTFQLYATDAINEIDGGAFSLLPLSTKPTDAGSWIKIAQTAVTLQPGLQARIPFTMLVPSDATPGDHTAGIVASVSRASTGKSGQAITLEQRVGVRLYLHVAGQSVAKISTAGLVAGFSPAWNPFAGGETSLDFSLSNSGNSRVDVKQTVIIHGPFGITVATFNAPTVHNLLPGQSVHEHLTRSDIPALLLLFSQVTSTPIAPTDRVAESKLRSADGSLVAPAAAPKFTAVSGETMTGAISWTLLALLVLLAIGLWILARYRAYTRDQLYDAIDAAALAARESAIAETTAERDRHSVDNITANAAAGGKHQ